MSDGRKFVDISKAGERLLDRLAETSPFWAGVRAKYAMYDTLTGAQAEAFARERDRAAWLSRAPRIDGKPIRNRYRTAGGRPRCLATAALRVGGHGRRRDVGLLLGASDDGRGRVRRMDTRTSHACGGA